MLNVEKPKLITKTKGDTIRSFFDLGAAVHQDFDPSRVLHDGFVLLSAHDAGLLIDRCRYERQSRDQTPGGRKHVMVLADIMKRGAWRAKDKLDFALLDGRHILVNGHHRLTAQATAGVDVEWTVVIHACKSEVNVADLYYSFDTNVRIRSNSNILAATNINEELGIPASAAEALYRAIPLIEADFDPSVASRDPVVSRVIDRRLERMRSFADEAYRYDKAISSAPVPIKKKLRGQGPHAVALMTFRHQREDAERFWGGVADGDGLRKGDPRHTYLRLLTSEIGAVRPGTAEYGAKAAAVAWNAFFEGRSISMIRVNDGKLRIAGTTVRGR